jgi:hypothetical protein
MLLYLASAAISAAARLKAALLALSVSSTRRDRRTVSIAAAPDARPPVRINPRYRVFRIPEIRLQVTAGRVPLEVRILDN